MLIVIACMFGGILVGYLTKKKPFKFTQQTLTILVWMLLFLLGVTFGGNKQIMGSLQTIGLEAFVLSFCATLGSVGFAGILWYVLNRKRKPTL